MKIEVTTKKFLELMDIKKNSKEVEEIEQATQEIINIASKVIDKIIFKYTENDLESKTKEFDKSILSKFYSSDKGSFREDFITLHPFYDFKQDCIVYLLQEVIYKYNPSKGASFKTFVYQKIRGFMQRNFHNKYRTISLTSDLMKNYSRDIKKEVFANLNDERKIQISKTRHLLLNPYNVDFTKQTERLVYEGQDYDFERIEELKNIFNKILTKTEYKYLLLSIDQELTNIDISKLEGKTPQYVSKIIICAKNKIKNSKELERMRA